MDNIYSSQGIQTFINFITLIGSVIALIIGLDCVWRSKKHFNATLRWLTLSVGLLAIKKLLELTDIGGSDYWKFAGNLLDLGIAISLLVGFGKIYQIIRTLDGE